MVGVQLQHHYTPRQNQNSAVNHNVPAPFLSLITKPATRGHPHVLGSSCRLSLHIICCSERFRLTSCFLSLS